jgi:hypothetical protein
MRLVALALLALAGIQSTAPQNPVVLHIKVSIVDAGQRPVPVAGHALLISDEPPTAAPRRVITRPDGTADITVRPGIYIVESDRPSVMLDRAYEWTQNVTVVAGRDTTLELTAANAKVGAVTPGMESPPAAAAADQSSRSPLLAKWQDSVVALWTEHRHAAGFMVSASGLIATSHAALGDAALVEVQFSATDKVGGRVLTTDAGHDIAIVRIDPSAGTHAPPVPLACGSASASITDAQPLATIEVPLLGERRLTSGVVLKADQEAIDTDFALPVASAGAPVFAADGSAIGLTSIPETGGAARDDVRVVRASAICDLLAVAERTTTTASPSAAHLPVERAKPLPLDAIRSAAAARGFSVSPYAISSADFDILFITPVLLAGAASQEGRTGGAADTLSGLRALADFGEWSEYVSASPPVLFIRVTPKLVESLWMKVARGAASTQGASIPPIKHIGPGFSHMRVLCGGREIVPVHPFRIRTSVSETDAVDEGFYALDPMAIGPQCGTVSLVLSTVKDPGKTQTQVVGPGVIAQVWKDFSAYRE